MFNPENSFWKAISRSVDFIGFGLLWILLCLPVITIAPATSAFYYTVVKVFHHKNEGGFGIFIKSFRNNMASGMLVSIICIPVIIVIWYLDMYFSNNIHNNITTVIYVIYFVVAMIPIGIIYYALSLMGRFSFSTKQLFITSTIMAIKHLPSTIIIVLEVLILLVFTLKFVWPILFTPTLAVLIASVLLERIFPKYLNESELKKFNDKDRMI